MTSEDVASGELAFLPLVVRHPKAGQWLRAVVVRIDEIALEVGGQHARGAGRASAHARG